MSGENSLDQDVGRFLDGEMPEEEARAFAARLAEDPELAARLAALRAQTERLRAEVPDPDPAALAGLMARAERSAATQRGAGAGWRIAATLAALAIGLSAGYGIAAARYETRLAAAELQGPALVVRDAARAHALYTVEVRHPVEVGGEERDHLSRWLSNRFGAEMEVPDLSAAGYTLVGGRLLPFDGGPAALYMYEREDGFRITLFCTTAADGAAQSFRFSQSDGLGTVYWQERNWRYTVVGEAPRQDLEALALTFYGELT